MKKKIMASILAAMMILTIFPCTALAATDGNGDVATEKESKIEDSASELKEGAPVTNISNEVGTKSMKAASAPTAEAKYEVSSNAELKDALDKIAKSGDSEAIIVLKADVTAPAMPENANNKYLGVKGKHITVKSPDGEKKKLSFVGRGIMEGDCTFDNVNVTGSRLFCNGYRTVFTENGEIHLSETLYGGGYKTTVASTYVVIAATGYINPTSSSGLHNVIGGSYQGSVEGDTYIEISGNIKFQGGNHINPGCMKGDGSSGDGSSSPDVYVGGKATLVYDNENTETRPSIEGTYGCEMKGDVTLDIRSGAVLGIVGTEEPVESSVIRGDLHLIAGSSKYENTDRILRLAGNWPIVGVGHSFATMPGAKGNYSINGNITIDTYENVWGWDKNTDPESYDLPEIYGAIRGDVGGNIVVNVYGSHVQNIFGASDSTVKGTVTVNVTDAELKNSLYDTDDDEGYVFGLWEKGIPSTASGPVTVNIDGGDIGLVMVTDQTTAPAGSSINVTGKPNIRMGIRGTQAPKYSTEFPVANIHACEAEIPFIKMMSQVNITENSNINVHVMTNNAGLLVKKGSTLITDENQVYIWGNTVINGTWEQKHSQTANYNDIFISGNTEIGESGHLINHGTSNLKGTVTNKGVMALMAPAYLQNDYSSDNGELRLPAVITNYDGKSDGAKIPVFIKRNSTGTTTVNTVDPANWQTLKKPSLGDNYILSRKSGDAPAQDIFLLGNEDALKSGWFLKRMADADGTDDYYMWQVVSGIRVVFDKNGGDTEASSNVMLQEKVEGAVNHFDLPTVEPTRNGYEFKGWNIKPDGTGDIFTAKTDVTNSITVYAQWEKIIEKGDLTVSNTVSGNGGDTTKVFNFTVKLNSAINGTYGDMTFKDGVATFTLKHNEKKTAVGLPEETSFEVTETEANTDGYTTTSQNASGSIVKDTVLTADFINSKNSSVSGESSSDNNNKKDEDLSANDKNTGNNTIQSSKTQTADRNTPGLWIAMMAASMLVLIVTVIAAKKRHNNGYNRK